MAPRSISMNSEGTVVDSNEKPTGLVRVVRGIFRFIASLGILESLGISRTASFQKYRSRLLSFLFDVNTTLPWGVYLVGELVKRANAWTRCRDGTINRRLADFLEIKVPASEKPKNGVSSKDVVIDEDTNVWVRIFTPSEESVSQDSSCSEFYTESNRRPVLIFYHGGGFGVLCANERNYDILCRTMARTFHVVVVSANYRRAPEHRYPTAYQDSFQVIKWLQSADSHAHLPPMADISRCFLMGDSAGGNIAHFMACRVAELKEKELLPLRIRGVVLLQPFFGSEQRTQAEITLANVPMLCTDATDWHWKAFLPDGADRDHPACNVFGPNASDISQLALPPIFLVKGTLDVLVDHQTNYESRMREMGKSIKAKNYVGGFHAFYIFIPVGTKIALACLADIKKFIQSHSDERTHPERY
ncbi:unnamed protein product [Calypogeia fissa]